jgi:hypothetical protein
MTSTAPISVKEVLIPSPSILPYTEARMRSELYSPWRMYFLNYSHELQSYHCSHLL